MWWKFLIISVKLCEIKFSTKMSGFVKMMGLIVFIYFSRRWMEKEYPYSWQLREILSFLANFPYHEELIILRYKYYWNRMKYWLCYNSNYNNISYASTHKRMLDANGKSLRTWGTRSVETRRTMLYPTCRLSPTWREAILWLELRTILISKMCYLPTRRKSNNFVCSEICWKTWVKSV